MMMARIKRDADDQHAADRFAYFMKKFNESDVTFGAKVGLSREQIRKYRLGKNAMNIGVATKLARALGINVIEFLNGGELPDEGIAMTKEVTRLCVAFNAIRRAQGRAFVIETAEQLAAAEKLAARA